MTFSGLRYVGKVDGYAVPGVNVRTHNSRRSTLKPMSFSVPEPTSLLLLGAQLLALGSGFAGSRVWNKAQALKHGRSSRNPAGRSEMPYRLVL